LHADLDRLLPTLEPYERHTVRNFLASRLLLDKSYASLTSTDDLEARLDFVRSIENMYRQRRR
jgi:hypothetical protein